jgi:hypothetical protein
MSDNIFWVYNGWAILITGLYPIITAIDSKLRDAGYAYWSRNVFFPVIFVSSVVALLILSNWITAVLYLPLGFVGILDRKSVV